MHTPRKNSSRPYLIFFYLLTLALSPTLWAQTKAPIKITIAPALLAQLDEATRAAVLSNKAFLESKLFTWDEFPINAPDSTFRDAEFISLSELIISPNSAEVSELGGDKFDDAQKAQVRREGLFVIPSKQYPGQYHVWKVSAWVQTGSDAIELKFNSIHKFAAEQIKVQIPRATVGRSPEDLMTLAKGVRHIGQGLSRSFDALLGSRAMTKAYSSEEVSHILTKQFNELNPDLRAIDDPTKTTAYTPVLERITEEVNQKWETGLASERQQHHLQVARAESSNELEIAHRVNDLLERDLSKLLVQAVSESSELAKIDPALPKQLADRLHANIIVQNFEDTIRVQIEQARATITEAIRTKHPRRAATQSWLDVQVEKEFRKYYQSERFALYAPLVSLLKEAGLNAEATRTADLLTFLNDNAEAHDKDFRNAREPLREYVVPRTIWNSNNWIVRKSESGVYSHSTALQQRITTRTPGWRLWLFGLRWKNYMLNGVRWVAARNFINGPLGVRSLVGKEAYYAHKIVDPQTGEIVTDTTRITQTMRTRWIAITETIKDDLRRAKATENRGLLSARANEILANVRYRFAKQLLLKGGLAIGQPALTTCNAVASAAACASAPAWSAGAAALVWLVNTTLFDFDSPHYRRKVAAISPLLQNLVVKFGLLGVGQTVAASLRIVAHLVAAGGAELYAYGRTWTVQLKDAIAYKIFLDSNALHTPSENSALATRIQGPGLASDHFFQIKPEIGLVALQLTLEEAHLELYKKQILALARQPVTAAELALKQSLSPFASVSANLNDHIEYQAEILASAQKAQVALELAVKERSEFLNRVQGDTGSSMSQVRLQQSDLDKLNSLATPVVEKYYRDHLAPLLGSDQAREAFWKAEHLAPDDFDGLAKRYLTLSFSDAIQTSLESIDPKFRIAVSDEPRLSRLADKVMDGVKVTALDNAPITIVDNGTITAPVHTTKAEDHISVRRQQISGRLRRCEFLVSSLFEGKI